MARAVLLVLTLAGMTTPAAAGCFDCLPAGFFGCGQRLGLGPGYPGLFPPTYVCPGWFGYNWMPEPKVIVVPGPPIQVYIAPEPRGSQSETATKRADVTPRSESRDEVARAHRLYPRGIPGVSYVWFPGPTVVKLNQTPPQEK